jgi:hypothetical protein
MLGEEKMFRYLSHCLLISLIVVSALVGSARHLASTAAAQEPQFSAAAATPIEQGGQFGKIYLSTVPLNCVQYSTQTGKKVALGSLEHPSIAVTTSPGVSLQKVGVETLLLQVDAYHGYQILERGPDEVFINAYETYPNPVQPGGYFSGWKAGPDYVIGYLITWYPPDLSEVTGQAIVIQTNYFVTVNGVLIREDAPVCGSYWKPAVTTSASSGTVNSTLTYALDLYPLSVPVSVKWDGATITSVNTTNQGTASGSLRIPAAPLGTHKLTFSTGHWNASATFTVKPRIKVIPTTGLKRGQTVNVSLRGYAKYETVRIRWKKGTSWVQVGQVKTSGTGSANIYIKVPTWAPAGTNSVRGDGTYGHAQTNAVTVVASASTASSAKASPTPTKTATPTPTAIPTTATPSPTTTLSATVDVSTPDATATPTVTETATVEPAPDETATPTPATETPTSQPPSEATAEASPGAGAPGEDAG